MGENIYEAIVSILPTPFNGDKILARHEVIVRCKDCKHFEPFRSMTGSEMSEGRCERNDMYVGAGEFCPRAERSEK